MDKKPRTQYRYTDNLSKLKNIRFNKDFTKCIVKKDEEEFAEGEFEVVYKEVATKYKRYKLDSTEYYTNLCSLLQLPDVDKRKTTIQLLSWEDGKPPITNKAIEEAIKELKLFLKELDNEVKKSISEERKKLEEEYNLRTLNELSRLDTLEYVLDDLKKGTIWRRGGLYDYEISLSERFSNHLGRLTDRNTNAIFRYEKISLPFIFKENGVISTYYHIRSNSKIEFPKNYVFKGTDLTEGKYLLTQDELYTFFEKLGVFYGFMCAYYGIRLVYPYLDYFEFDKIIPEDLCKSLGLGTAENIKAFYKTCREKISQGYTTGAKIAGAGMVVGGIL